MLFFRFRSIDIGISFNKITIEYKCDVLPFWVVFKGEVKFLNRF
jgi:hypothetical protein